MRGCCSHLKRDSRRIHLVIGKGFAKNSFVEERRADGLSMAEERIPTLKDTDHKPSSNYYHRGNTQMGNHLWMLLSFKMGFSLHSPRDWKGLRKGFVYGGDEGRWPFDDIIKTHFEYYIRIVFPGLMAETNITLYLLMWYKMVKANN
ncbi:hypothetical protein CDAR_203561 [Caerostris darwini]|uniref:Uncharacterized protein n=1 Tax=Caerostris darwini TaxID=1538125 RepID=A0AAV4TTD8_9ARAC|nr:hypothetical protein CDAR_203561 [Caerostris darwini]